MTDHVDGVVIGLLMGFENGLPLVVFAGNQIAHAISARSLAPLGRESIGKEVALLFEDGDRNRPLIVGQIVEPAVRVQAPMVVRDGERMIIQAKERIELRVGKSAIIMDEDGHITIRGTYVNSHASSANRIRGGSISLN